MGAETGIAWTDHVFVKQLGARPVEIGGGRLGLKDAKGGKPSEWATDLRVREFPPEHMAFPAASPSEKQPSGTQPK